MNIATYIDPITNGEILITKLLQDKFAISSENTKYIYEKYVKNHFDRLKDSIYLLVETNYVDKVYRDSYYCYYSSKLSDYKRYCIKISLFEGSISKSDFWNTDQYSFLQEKYRGFIVLRPTWPQIIGRNIISPAALKATNFLTCTATYHTTVNGQKFTVEGFPHSSQDAETITCAETTLWAIMEYFGNKYPDYKPTLPSKIVHALKKISYERQLPSKGLLINQLSFALKEFGFGTRIYSRNEYSNEFDNLLSCYIESGIPVIAAMENKTIGHALLVIGHEKIDATKVDLDFASGDIYDYNAIKKNFIFGDDNHPIYQKAPIETPALYYNDGRWKDCKINYFIVPLYTKIYLDAFEAKTWAFRFLQYLLKFLHCDNPSIVLRLFLASSRTFKDTIALNATMQDSLKIFLMESVTPKFIWIAEISTKDLIKQNMANGIVVFDATEKNTFFWKPLILAAFKDNVVDLDKTGKLTKKIVPFLNFKIFEHNLKMYD